MSQVYTPPPVIYESKSELPSPSDYSRKKSWTDRGQYGLLCRGIIQSQYSSYKREKNRQKKTKIAQSIGFLLQVQNSLIVSEKEIEARIDKLEQILNVKRPNK
jgi:hypothetical protein